MGYSPAHTSCAEFFCNAVVEEDCAAHEEILQSNNFTLPLQLTRHKVAENQPLNSGQRACGNDLQERRRLSAEGGRNQADWADVSVLTGQERKNHFGFVILDPERPSPTILSGAV